MRFTIFRDNLETIAAHNEEARAGKHSFTLGATVMADLTNAEYRKLYLGYSKPKPVDAPLGVFDGSSVTDMPASVDWRTKNVVVRRLVSLCLVVRASLLCRASAPLDAPGTCCVC